MSSKKMSLTSVGLVVDFVAVLGQVSSRGPGTSFIAMKVWLDRELFATTGVNLLWTRQK